MPFYDYDCDSCGEFRLLRSMEERNSPARCPHCSAEGTRIILAPNLAVMNPMVRKAAFINERSRHEPRVSKSSHQCGSGCGCGTPVRQKRLRETKLGKVQTGKAGSRPWMLGH
jgi:putative FmdB family regulatory protein